MMWSRAGYCVTARLVMVSVGMFRSGAAISSGWREAKLRLPPRQGEAVRGGAFFETGVASANGGQSAADVAKSIAPAKMLQGLNAISAFITAMKSERGIPAEPLAFVGTSDLAGHFRGKGFALSELDNRIRFGVGLAPSNIMLSAFGPIYETPFGTAGELVFKPDPQTEVKLQLDADSCPPTLFLGDIMTLAGEHWSVLPARFPAAGVDRADGTGRAARLRRLRAGICLYRRRSARSALLAGCVSPQRRFWPAAARRVARGRHHPRLIPRGIWALPIRGHSQTSRRAQGRR